MTKVKFNVNSDYMYIQNFNVLQSKLSAASMLYTKLSQTPSLATTSTRQSPSKAS
jgi:hypothetical protein